MWFLSKGLQYTLGFLRGQKKISLDPMAGSRTVSEVVVVVLLRAQSSSSKLLGVVEGGLCSGGREVHESVLSMTGFNIEPVFYAKKKKISQAPHAYSTGGLTNLRRV